MAQRLFYAYAVYLVSKYDISIFFLVSCCNGYATYACATCIAVTATAATAAATATAVIASATTTTAFVVAVNICAL